MDYTSEIVHYKGHPYHLVRVPRLIGESQQHLPRAIRWTTEERPFNTESSYGTIALVRSCPLPTYTKEDSVCQRLGVDSVVEVMEVNDDASNYRTTPTSELVLTDLGSGQYFVCLPDRTEADYTGFLYAGFDLYGLRFNETLNDHWWLYNVARYWRGLQRQLLRPWGDNTVADILLGSGT